MEIHTKDKKMKEHLGNSIKSIDKYDERIWSEYELRLLIQDELSSINYKGDSK